jgi:hypothetical protein
MKTESNLQDHEPRRVTGVKGVASKFFDRRFANAQAMERWLAANEGDLEVHTIERA